MPDNDVRHIMINGEGANHLEFLPLNNTPANIVASSQHSDFPAYFQIDRYAIRPGRPWLAGTLDPDQQLVIDKNQLFNPGAETNSTAGWSIEGAIGVASSPVHSGAKAFSHTPSAEAGTTQLQTVRARAGEKVTIEVWLASPNATVPKVQTYIRELGLFLQTDGSWAATEVDWASETGSAYAFKTKTAVMPAYTNLVPRGVYTVEIYAYTDLGTGGAAFVDDWAFWHWTDTAGIAGHNVHPAISATEMRYSTDNFNSSDVLVSGAFATLKWPTSYALLPTLRGERWWMYKYVGESDVALWNGQLTLSQKLVLSRNPNYEIIVETVQSQVRHETTAGVDTVFLKEDIQRRQFSFPFSYHDVPQWQEARDRLFHMSVFGKWPTLMIHDDTNAESFAIVRPPERFDITHRSFNVRDAHDFQLRELAFPTFD